MSQVGVSPPRQTLVLLSTFVPSDSMVVADVSRVVNVI